MADNVFTAPQTPDRERRRRLARPSGSRYLGTRPGGITALAVLNFITAGLSALVLLYLIATPNPADAPLYAANDIPADPTNPFGVYSDMWLRQSERQSAGSLRGAATLFGAVGLVTGLPVGLGLWLLKSWGRKLALYLYGGGTFLSLLANFSRPLTGSALMGIVVGGLITYYLLRPEVIAAFYRHTAD